MTYKLFGAIRCRESQEFDRYMLVVVSSDAPARWATVQTYGLRTWGDEVVVKYDTNHTFREDLECSFANAVDYTRAIFRDEGAELVEIEDERDLIAMVHDEVIEFYEE